MAGYAERIMDIYESECQFYLEFVNPAGTKFDWAASEIFDLVTYDYELNEFLVRKILKVCKVILDRNVYDYIYDKEQYLTYILVCQMLHAKNWIEWGTSIRGCWFDSSDSLDCDDIVHRETYENGQHIRVIVPFSESHLRILIKFLEDSR